MHCPHLRMERDSRCFLDHNLVSALQIKQKRLPAVEIHGPPVLARALHAYEKDEDGDLEFQVDDGLILPSLP